MLSQPDFMFERFQALQDIDDEDVNNLQNSKVGIVGLGATGSVISEHLARHGIDLVVIDRDYLEEKDSYSSNIYTPAQCETAMPKAIAAQEYLSKFTDVKTKVASISSENISILEDVDIIVDGTDNLETRKLLNEYSKKKQIPWIYTAAIGKQGYSMLFDKKCFSCMIKGNPELATCESAGIMREISSLAGSISALKCLNYLIGRKVGEKLDTVSGESFDVETEGCQVCEKKAYPILESGKKTSSVCGENKYQVEDVKADLEKVKEVGEVLAENSFLVRINYSGSKVTAFSSGRFIVEAEDKGHARALVSEITGK